MPWWSWVVIWVVLVLALLGMLAWMAWRLFRKGVAVLDELDALAAKTELLDRAADVAEEQRRELAILVGADELRRRREFVRAAAAERKSDRHDARIARGKALVKVDPASREWFSAR
ncbi:MAG: inosine 5-monophosphate dehydrogenase [Microbacteriaceae bacterium]|nr:inosine 5-monophosphate dehydrogenase [Microbacteriaceae bacterium]